VLKQLYEMMTISKVPNEEQYVEQNISHNVKVIDKDIERLRDPFLKYV